MDKYGLPKTTVWHHTHAIVLSEEQKTRLRSRQGGSHVKYLAEIVKARDCALKLLCSKDRELVMLVAMLYWAEGHKKAFVFTNTDEKMLSLYLKFIYEVMNIPQKSVSILIRTSDPITPIKAQIYWAKALSIPKINLSVNHDNKQNRTKTRYGICRIMVAKSSFYLKVMNGLIETIQEDILISKANSV
jgi:hypothetical protein